MKIVSIKKPVIKLFIGIIIMDIKNQRAKNFKKIKKNLNKLRMKPKNLNVNK
jgi:uncharacterized membrane-anchored protein YhcB (DUF1043 family)